MNHFDIERNDNPFDSNLQRGRQPQQHTRYVTRSQLITTIVVMAVFMAILFFSTIAIAYLIYTGAIKRLYPSPINQNNFNIEYTFTEEPLIAIADHNARFVVEIMVGEDTVERGSGVIIQIYEEYALILTNYHVISSNVSATKKPIRIKLFGSAGYSNTDACTVIGFDQFNDVAVVRLNYSLGAAYKDENNNFLSVKLPSYLKVTDTGVNPARYSVDVNYSFMDDNAVEEDTLVMGKRVLALGNALGQGMSACDGVISMPLNNITVNTGNGYTNTVIQTTAPINPGNSGGGLFDTKGQLVAINTYKSRTVNSGSGTQYVDNISYSIPVELAFSSAYRIINHYENTDSYLYMLNEQGKPYSPTLYNIGIELYLASDISGAQENSVLVLGYTSKAGNVPTSFQLENGTPAAPARAISDSGKELRDDNGKFASTILSVASVSFNPADYSRRLSLMEYRFLLLKVQCELYKYGGSVTHTGAVGTGNMLEITEQSTSTTTYLASALKLIG